MIEVGTLLIVVDTVQSLPRGTQCIVYSDPPQKYGISGGGTIIFEGTTRPGSRKVWSGSLVEAMVYAMSVHGFEIEGKVTKCIEEQCLIRFAIRSPPKFFTQREKHRPLREMARLFSCLSFKDCKVEKGPYHANSIKQLHSSKISDLFPLLNTVDESMAVTNFLLGENRSWIERLPNVVLNKVFDFCDPTTFRALQSCNHYLHEAAKDSIPSIKTQLLTHQRKSLRWMTWREQSNHKIPHPLKNHIQTEWGILEIDEIAGTLRPNDKPFLNDVRGGILADEPGLGKTATILSLVMRTRGILPSVTEKMCWERQELGRNDAKRADDFQKLSALHSLRPRSNFSSPFKPVSPPIFMDPMFPAPPSSILPSPKRKRTTIFKKASTSDASSSDISMDLSEDNDVDSWVQCDKCNTWRMLPTTYKLESDSFWTCDLHPNPEERECQKQSPSDEMHDIYVHSESGYVSSHELVGTKDNICYFTHVLQSFASALTSPINAVSVLCNCNPQELHNGFLVRSDWQVPKDYASIYSKLGLIQIVPENHRKRSRFMLEQFLDNSTDRDQTMMEQHFWKIPDTHIDLNLDTEALRVALEPLMEREVTNRFLSSATLIVVPFPLIEQWKQEIRKHFTGDHARVRVITRKKDYPKSVCQLAWRYDIVLTSFTHLSTQISERLLNIHWLRVVLDEGHLLGSTLTHTSRKGRIFALDAERRWIITGTPTPDLVNQSSVSHLFPLIQFLKVEPYHRGRVDWETAIQKPFEAGLPEGRDRLLALLNRLMIRTFKDEIRDLVRVHKKIHLLDFEAAHAASYNEFIENVQRNLILADLGEEGHVESLLNPNNTKWTSEVLRNLHMSCCVAGNCFLRVHPLQLADTLSKLAERNGYSLEFLDGHPWWTPITHPLRHVEEALCHGGICSICRDLVRLPIVTPCAHLLCESCLKSDREKCAYCGNAYLMQSAEDASRLMHNLRPKLPVPIEVIEWQPSYAQLGAVGKSGGGWHPDWKATQSSKCKHLVNRLIEIGVHKEDVSKRVKVIVFSNFWPHINLIDQSLWQADIPHCLLKRDTKASEKNNVVDVFRNRPEFNVLLMDVTGAVGLDLSMASYVFLMEPLLDRSVEEQIVSRAHRMGAKEDVHVEVLIMKGSIEELATKYLSDYEKKRNGCPSRDPMEENITLRNTLITGLTRVRT